MKRIALILLTFVILMSFCSCFSTQNDFNDVKTLLTHPVCISAVIEQETTIHFKAYVYENDTLFTFSEPETLRLLSVKKNADGYFAQYDGIETKIDSGSIMAVDSLELAIKAIGASETCGQQVEDGQNVLLFSLDGITVLVYYDNKNNQITKIISEANGQPFSYQILSVETIQT